MTASVGRIMRGPLFGLDGVGFVDIAVTVLLSVAIACLVVFGVSGGHRLDAGPAGAAAALLMTLPVVAARRYPIGAAAALLLGVLINWSLVGSYVRCGAALPAVFIVAFSIGNRCDGWQRLLGAAIVAVDIGAQTASDPQLAPASTVILLAPIGLAFLGLGAWLQWNRATVSALRDKTLALEAQRDANARLAVEADRQRISRDLDNFLHAQVQAIATAAAAGQAVLGSMPSEVEAAFAEIQDIGRATLTHMRDVVRTMKSRPKAPQPVLAQLNTLFAQARFAPVKLEVTGEARSLSPGLELAGFRIVEHLLVTLAGDTEAGGKVEVMLGTEAIEIRVSGPGARGAESRAALSAAIERAALHGGSLVTDLRGGHRKTVVTLPLGVAA
jgi:signal transduction histidine kinase